jgi:hypothetical protein
MRLFGAVIADFAHIWSRDIRFCTERRSARSSVRNVFRIATSSVPLHSGRKPEGPDNLPPRERIADTVRTEAARRVLYKVPR